MNTDEASRLIDRLGDAFAAADIERVVTLFAAEGDVIYAGSEPDEVAVGRPALRLLLTDLFNRSERYSWRCESVCCVTCAAGVLVLAVAVVVNSRFGKGAFCLVGYADYRNIGIA